MALGWGSSQACIKGCVLDFADRDMAGRHQARPSSIQIRQVAVVPSNKCRRPHIKQMHVSETKLIVFTCLHYKRSVAHLFGGCVCAHHFLCVSVSSLWIATYSDCAHIDRRLSTREAVAILVLPRTKRRPQLEYC